jgi:predicted permease
MNSFIASVNAVLPIFLMFSLGYLLRKIKLVDDDLVSRVNRLVFKIFLPLMLFNNIYQSDLTKVFNVKLIVFAILSVVITFILSLLFITSIRKEPKRRGAMIQAIFRSNYVILGIPVITALFGEKNTVIPSLLAAFVVPVFNLLAVITLEVFRGNKPQLTQILKSIIKKR